METSMSILIPTFKAPKWIAEWVDTIWMDLNFTARVAISHDQRTCPPGDVDVYFCAFAGLGPMHRIFRRTP